MSRPNIEAARKQAEQAVTVLRSAIDRLHPPRDDESLDDVALRLRGSAVLAHTAGLELAYVAGVHAAEAGVLDGEEREDG